jgi:acyl dehydratase
MMRTLSPRYLSLPCGGGTIRTTDITGEDKMGDLGRTQGMTFEEFEIGDSAESPGRTVTEADIYNFAGMSGDNNPLHTDAEYGKSTVFGQRIAHGLLGLSIASGLAWRTGFLQGTAEALIGIDWKFRNPIFVGDTIRAVAEVTKKRARKSLKGGFITFAIKVLNQRDEVVQKGTWTVLVRSEAYT